jgi:hypothetical protein
MDGANFRLSHWATSIDGLTQKVENATEGGFTYGNSHWSTCVGHGHAACQTICAAQGNAANTCATQLLLNLACELDVNTLHEAFHLEGVVNFGKVTAWEFGVES